MSKAKFMITIKAFYSFFLSECIICFNRTASKPIPNIRIDRRIHPIPIVYVLVSFQMIEIQKFSKAQIINIRLKNKNILIGL